MTIHHSQAKKAEKMGVTLSEDGDQIVGFWPKRALKLVGPSAGDVLAQMQAAHAIINNDSDTRLMPDPNEPRLVWVHTAEDMTVQGCPMTPVELHKAIMKGATWVKAGIPDAGAADQQDGDAPAPDGPEHPDAYVDDHKPEVERINGIAIDGGVAYREGTLSADCPYSSEDEDAYDDFIRWNDEWDAAADGAEEEEKHGGSVVSEKYRAKYAELGHPTHCGDWLANLLNNLCITEKSGTDLDRFEAICNLNGVDTGKYKRSGVGWQGRIRMTGRNLLAKKVYIAGGILRVPGGDDGETEFRAPADWMEHQKYKMPKAEQKTVVAYAGKN